MVDYLVYNNPQLIPIFGQMKTVHIFIPYTSKNHFNIILPSTSTSRSPT